MKENKLDSRILDSLMTTIKCTESARSCTITVSAIKACLITGKEKGLESHTILEAISIKENIRKESDKVEAKSRQRMGKSTLVVGIRTRCMEEDVKTTKRIISWFIIITDGESKCLQEALTTAKTLNQHKDHKPQLVLLQLITDKVSNTMETGHQANP